MASAAHLLRGLREGSVEHAAGCRLFADKYKFRARKAFVEDGLRVVLSQIAGLAIFRLGSQFFQRPF